MTQEIEDSHSTEQTAVFDTSLLDRELRREEAYARTGHTARALVRRSDLRIVLVVMKDGSRIPEHRTDETASVHVLSGHLRLRLSTGSVDLGPGQFLVIERAVLHDVDALAESSFLLTLGWKNK